MKIIIVKENEAGQRLDKLLFKWLNEAPSSFVYKMLRKKNITLNGKKAEGRELLLAGDEIKFFLSEETYEKFSVKKNPVLIQNPVSLKVVFEDDNLLLIDKPAGILSQKAKPSDLSINEYCIDYLIKSGSVTKESLKSFTPSVCNRLDRNTSGLILCAKTLTAAQQLSKALKDRTIHKYYQCLVAADIRDECHIKGFLIKNKETNRVYVLNERPIFEPEASEIETRYLPLKQSGNLTLLKVELITGKPHQIRAHLASLKAPIVGDHKYGNPQVNQYYKTNFGLTSQLLHSYRLELPSFSGTMENLSGKVFEIALPPVFDRIIKDIQL